MFPFPELCNKRIGILYFEQLKKALFDVRSKAQFIGNRERILQLELFVMCKILIALCNGAMTFFGDTGGTAKVGKASNDIMV